MSNRATTAAFDYEHAHYERSVLCHFTPARIDELLDDLGLPPEWFPGKRVLDAGCGSGRWSYALAELGAHVTAVDASSEGVRVTQEMFDRGGYAKCFAQVKDLTNLGGLAGVADPFDLVLSWGVLHHTAEPEQTFKQLVPFVAPGGYMKVMLYEQTNALQPVITDLIRRLLRHVSPEDRYAACAELLLTDQTLHEALWPYVYVFEIPPGSTPAFVAQQQFACYDAYSPIYNFRFTKEQVLLWFLLAGFAEVTLQSVPRFHSGSLTAARYGECGGAIHVRGRRPD